MDYDSSSDNNDPNDFRHQLSDHSGEDIYENDEEHFQDEPENILLVRERKNTGEIEQSCVQVKNFLIKTSSSKRTTIANPLKKLVSKRKYRFSLDGFNLDLTYITNQIIAMGFPADDVEKYYRNSMADVQRFFNQRHPGHYKIINLCAERKYKHSCFNNMVSEYPFEDHQAPTMKIMYSMCEELLAWLERDKNNVAAIHCKAGKGRTGVMICCYLLYCKMFTNSYDAMRYYGTMRTNNKKGVTIPSQIRYIIYFEKCLAKGWRLQDIPITPMRLTRIRMVTIPNFNYSGACEPWFIITNGDRKLTQEVQTIHNEQIQGDKISKSDGFIDFEFDMLVQDDVRVVFFNKSVLDKKQKMFQFWFNTSFFEPTGKLVIDKYMLDGAVKDKGNKKFSANFRVEVDGVQLSHPAIKKYSGELKDQSPQKQDQFIQSQFFAFDQKLKL